jgi:hypothetical protein
LFALVIVDMVSIRHVARAHRSDARGTHRSDWIGGSECTPKPSLHAVPPCPFYERGLLGGVRLESMQRCHRFRSKSMQRLTSCDACYAHGRAHLQEWDDADLTTDDEDDEDDEWEGLPVSDL